MLLENFSRYIFSDVTSSTDAAAVNVSWKVKNIKEVTAHKTHTHTHTHKLRMHLCQTEKFINSIHSQLG